MHTSDTPGARLQHLKRTAHWQRVYSDRDATQASWYQAFPAQSLRMIDAAGIGRDAHLIDIGGGASRLIDYLLEAGYRHTTVLDIAQKAIDQAKERLGENAERVEWLVQDIMTFRPAAKYDFWHDRAVFHFLTEAADRECYLQVLNRALHPGAHAVIATFGPRGPESCSGLDVVRYTPESLQSVLGDSLKIVKTAREEHMTPNGSVQDFIYCLFVKTRQPT